MNLLPLLLPLISLAWALNPNCPRGLRVRKEFRDLSPQEWLDFKSALFKLYAITIDGQETYMDRFTRIQLENLEEVNGSATYLPWHRYFLVLLENDLRTFSPNVTLPYWNWASDYPFPSSSILFNPLYLGVELPIDCHYRLQYPTPHCLKRDYDRLRFGTYYDSYSINKLVSDRWTSYAKFSELMEQAPATGNSNFSVNSLLNEFSDLATTNDPAFILHQTQVDRLWDLWQKSRRLFPGGNPNEYNGFNKRTGLRASLKDEISPFRMRVEQVMVADEQLCYVYAPPGTKLEALVLAEQLQINDS